jgi:hypothetical protein
MSRFGDVLRRRLPAERQPGRLPYSSTLAVAIGAGLAVGSAWWFLAVPTKARRDSAAASGTVQPTLTDDLGVTITPTQPDPSLFPVGFMIRTDRELTAVRLRCEMLLYLGGRIVGRGNVYDATPDRLPATGIEPFQWTCAQGPIDRGTDIYPPGRVQEQVVAIQIDFSQTGLSARHYTRREFILTRDAQGSPLWVLRGVPETGLSGSRPEPPAVTGRP